ncbi:hypothetical protein OUZ56_005982 [Daphnia magna]|uniref:Uncharacterized protein n=1 Tax=Daphnia magna TaxID=35525 RepID=A0ABQ9YVP8_9CRUS|nr:hypothetical protein OUZ56_005982 [Daphnia magna]
MLYSQLTVSRHPIQGLTNTPVSFRVRSSKDYITTDSLGVLLVGRLHDTKQYTTALNSTNNTTATQNHYTGLLLWPAIDGLLRPLPSGQSGKVH